MTQEFVAQNPHFESVVHDIVERHGLARTLGYRVDLVEPGRVDLLLDAGPHVSQQHGYVHAGAITAVVDTACGCAAISLAKPGREVVTVEFKVNFINPARADRFRCIGRVIKAGRTLSLCEGEVWPADGDGPMVAKMQTTMMVWLPDARRSENTES